MKKIVERLCINAIKVPLTVAVDQLTPETRFWSDGKASKHAAVSFADSLSRHVFLNSGFNKTRGVYKEIGELANATSDCANAGAIGGFSFTSEYECRVQPEPFEKALLTHQRTVAQMFGEKMQAPAAK